MKSYKNLYPQIHSFETLYTAYRAARRGKRGRVAVARFEFDLEHNLLELQAELREQSYRPGAYTNFHIYEPKRRLVSAAPFRDRVVHHALCRTIEPIWEARFVHTSFACRVGKGTHAALDQCQAWLRQYRYAFHGDVVKYFPSIDHHILRGLLARHIADRQTMGLVDRILDSGAGIQADECPVTYFPGDDLFAALRPRGLPIGNLTSQFWANVYLHELDLFAKHVLRCPAYLRYMDDFVLFGDDKAELHEARALAAQVLREQSALELKVPGTFVTPVSEGVPFLGLRIFPGTVRLAHPAWSRFRRRWRQRLHELDTGGLDEAAFLASAASLVGHLVHANTYEARKSVLFSPSMGVAA